MQLWNKTTAEDALNEDHDDDDDVGDSERPTTLTMAKMALSPVFVKRKPRLFTLW